MNRSDAEKEVRDILSDADHDRKRGGTQSNEEVLVDKLVEALSRDNAKSVR
jgi:hypothetical protein